MAEGVFPHDRLPLAAAYAAMLADDGVVRGLIGPREVPRLWERHLVNCALLSQAVPEGASVGDVGSGAGLPGLVLAIARPDVQVTLIEPLLRRSVFLDEVVAGLGLAQVTVVRGRADALHGRQTFDLVTSRAVAPLPRLLEWSMPLVSGGGAMVAMKGSSAGQEVADARQTWLGLGCQEPEVFTVSDRTGSSTATLVRVVRESGARVSSAAAKARRTSSGRARPGSKQRRNR